MIPFATTIYMIFILIGTSSPKDPKPKIFLGGENAFVHIDLLETMWKNVLELTFSDFNVRQLVQNVMILDLRKHQPTNISLFQTYTGRIEKIKIRNGSLSFFLLNVNVMDSGHYLVYEKSVVKGNISILVARKILHAQDGVSITLPFLCNTTQATSIKIKLMSNEIQFVVVKYDVTKAKCTEFGNPYLDRIDRCALRDSYFTFTLQQVTYLDVGTYVAWDDMGYLTDSILVAIEENSTTSNQECTRIFGNTPFIPNIRSLDTDNYHFEWILVAGLVFVLIATGMVICFVGRLREKKVLNTTMYQPTQRHILQSRANNSRNCIQNVEITHTREGTRIVVTENKTSDYRSSLSHNESQEHASLNSKHLCSLAVESTETTARNNHIDPSLVPISEHIQSEHIRKDDSLNSQFLQSKVLCNNPSKDCVKYDNTVQHSYTVLRPKTAIPMVNRKIKEHVTIDDSFAWSIKGNKVLSSIFNSSAFFMNVSTESLNDVDCTGSRTEIVNRELSYEASSVSWFDFENSCSSCTVCSKHYLQASQKKRNYQSIKYATYVPRPKSSEFQGDSRSPSVSLTMGYYIAGNDLANPSAIKTGPERSQSSGALYGNMASDGGQSVEFRL
ncbi:hypothetical protein ACJMK2_024941 [Sinanodonta woodiana]|uniref:Uncharacterized protein n=1 Tax=Sinanodonta woodiana TaxID=1069815 RepID=A0ABD3XFF8_SINWO